MKRACKLKFFILSVATWLFSSEASAQSNFTMSGALTDVGNDSILVEYVERNPDKKTSILLRPSTTAILIFRFI